MSELRGKEAGMLKKLQAVIVLLCMISYAEAVTVSIGTASVRTLPGMCDAVPTV